MWPQPSAIAPHVAPTSAQLTCVQPHFLATPPPPHVSGAAHVPHSTTLPQPSDTWPQDAPTSAQVRGRQGSVPQRFGPPPPHVPLAQVPHERVPAQPSGALPHSALSCWHVVGT